MVWDLKAAISHFYQYTNTSNYISYSNPLKTCLSNRCGTDEKYLPVT